jgi:hypothetical protein
MSEGYQNLDIDGSAGYGVGSCAVPPTMECA